MTNPQQVAARLMGKLKCLHCEHWDKFSISETGVCTKHYEGKDSEEKCPHFVFKVPREVTDVS